MKTFEQKSGNVHEIVRSQCALFCFRGHTMGCMEERNGEYVLIGTISTHGCFVLMKERGRSQWRWRGTSVTCRQTRSTSLHCGGVEIIITVSVADTGRQATL